MGIVRSQSIRNSLSFYIGMLFGAINTVIIYPNVFKDNPEHLGLIQIIIAYALVVSVFTTFGMPQTFVKFFPVVKQKGQLYFLALMIPLLGFGLACLCYYLFKESIFEILNASQLLKDNFFYIILLIFFIGFYNILSSISRSFLNSATPIFINEVFLKFYSMSVLLLYWFNFFDFSTFLKVYLLGYIIKFAILFLIQWWYDRFALSFSVKHLNLNELLRFGLYVMVGGTSLMIVTRVDMMMIGSLLDLQQVAFYTVAFFIGNAIQVPGRSVVSISAPLLAKAWENQNFNEIQLLYSKSSINQLIIGGVFFLCVWLNVDQIFLLLPEKFQGGKWVVFYIGISQLFNIASGVNGSIIVNSKYYKYDLYTNVLLLLITIVANYILIPIYGIDGAAMATALSVFLFNASRLTLIKVKMGMHPFSWNTVKTILLLLVMFIAMIYLPDTSYIFLDIVWQSMLVLILYVPAVSYLNLSEDITRIINEVQSRLFK
ncbi:MAG: polysaccharide biosynthesis C-terminal domain-containing protein [Bacteroidota bacterium]|nr:polysaccharide biosynthesis C-terminal domain-containing protein [Bacteroidota bacterium]